MRRAAAVLWIGIALGASAQEQRVAKVAAPGLRAAGVSEDAAQRISEAFAEELELEGLDVSTPKEIARLLGAEQQRQLVSCEQQSSSCLAELTSALQVEAVVTGTVARIGSRLHANLKLLSQGGQVFGVYSRSGRTEADLKVALADAAPGAALDVYKGLGRKVPEGARSQRRVQDHSNFVTWFVGGILFTAFGVEYERALTPRFSLVGMGLFVNGDLSVDGERTRDLGGELFLGGRFYLTGVVGNGLFAGAEVQLGYGLTEEESPTQPLIERSGALVAPGVLLGYAFTFPLGITGSLGLGVYRHLTSFSFSDSHGSTVQLVPRLNVGYAF